MSLFNFKFQRFAITTMPHLTKHQIRKGEDINKIRIVDDEGVHLSEACNPDHTVPTILANSMEYEKFLQKENSNSNV